MQTFLPYADFQKSAQVLDYRRLGKQRVETLQLLQALAKPVGAPWSNHPAARMWRGHEISLTIYGRAMCREWIHGRGFKDTCYQKITDMVDTFPDSNIGPPPWLGDPALHLSHRSNLLRKAPEHYAEIFESDLPNNLEYI